MKKQLFRGLFVSGFLLLQACTEKGVPIQFEDPVKPGSSDTTYQTTVEKAQERVVMIEEYTGASCTNCPDGHKRLAAILDANKGRVVAVSYHTFGGGEIFNPVHKEGYESKYDFRNNDATNISQFIYGGVTMIPTGGIDRMLVGGTRQIGRDSWALETGNRMAVAAPVNMTMSSTYEEGEVTLKVRLAYTRDISTKNVLTICVSESGIIDAQAYPKYVEPDYVHDHVLRQFLTVYSGMPVLDNMATKPAGQVYEYTYRFKPDASWNLDKCNIIAFLSNNETDDKLVLQAAETHLK